MRRKAVGAAALALVAGGVAWLLASGERGWSDERLPRGMRRGAAAPVLLWKTPSFDIEMVHVPPGDFTMGDDSLPDAPSHVHPMPRGYWIARTETTRRQWLAFGASVGAGGPSQPEGGSLDDPVVNVSWPEADAFCRWAGLALPTETQWEKAARGPSGQRFPWGSAWDGALANHGLEGPKEQPDASDGFRHAAPVGSFPRGASPFGALDMTGNVTEWCADLFEETAYVRYSKGDFAPPDPRSPDVDRFHVARGGSFLTPPSRCPPAVRHRPEGVSDSPAGHPDRGFRVVID